jgi:hypothetical protein
MTRRLTQLAGILERLVVRPPVAGMLYVALAVASTWPLAADPASRLPLGASGSTTVPLFNAWTIWWNADRATRGFEGYWDAPIFHPATNTFAFSEPQPTTLIVAPLIWLGGSPVLACNVYLLCSLFLNAVVGASLLRVLRARRCVAVAGGAAVLLLPAVHWQSDVVQLAPLWPSLWTLAALIRLSQRPRLRTGVEAGTAFAVAFLTCGHHGLFLAILLAASGWLLTSRLRDGTGWLAWLTAGTVAVVCVQPVAVKLHEVAEVRQFQRSRQSVEQLSLRPGDYAVARGRQIVDPGSLSPRSQWKVSPGILKYAFAGVGLLMGLCRRRSRRVTLFLAVFGAFGFALSLGTNLMVGTWRPWWTIAEFVPGASQVRNVFRFAFFVQMVVVLLAALGVSSLWSLVRALRCRLAASLFRRMVVRGGSLLVLAGGVAALIEVLPPPMKAGFAPNPVPQRDWINFLRASTPPGRAIACVPFSTGNQVQNFQATLWWMYLSTEHGVPLVNGYSGFFPREYFELRKQVNEQFPAERVLRRFDEAGVEFVLIATRQVASAALLQEVAASSHLERVFQSEAGVDIYRIRLLEGVARSPAAAPLTSPE